MACVARRCFLWPRALLEFSRRAFPRTCDFSELFALPGQLTVVLICLASLEFSYIVLLPLLAGSFLGHNPVMDEKNRCRFFATRWTWSGVPVFNGVPFSKNISAIRSVCLISFSGLSKSSFLSKFLGFYYLARVRERIYIYMCIQVYTNVATAIFEREPVKN